MKYQHVSWEKEKEVLMHAAREAGDVMLRSWGNAQIDYSHKSETEIVTKFDIEVENTLVSLLSKSFPDYGFIMEEENAIKSEAEVRWIIDPIDGTTNFAKGYPHFATSIALECAGELVLGVVYNPLRDELYSAIKGKGAFLNGEPIHVTQLTDMKVALLSTGFPYDTFQERDDNMAAWTEFFHRCLSVRCDGCASLDLCQVAAGRLDGYWEKALCAWDIAAGVVIASEAGATVTDLEGNFCNHHKGAVLAANAGMHKLMLDLLRTIIKD